MAILLPGKFLHLGTPRAASTATHAALKMIPGVEVFNQYISFGHEVDRYESTTACSR